MRRTPHLSAALLGLTLALTPALATTLAPTFAWARAGGGMSMGSRGSRTYMAPPTTRTSPFSAAPMERSFTQPTPAAPSYSSPYAPSYGYGRGSSFMSGLLGGMIGAGLGGLLFGHGLFGGIGSMAGFLGFLIQIFLLVLLVRWLLRRAFGPQPAFAGMSPFARKSTGPLPMGSAGPRAGSSVAIGPLDYQAFERTLKEVQAAWTAHDLNRLATLATPEMVGYFSEQLAEQASRGVRNSVTDVRLERGDLSEAWVERGRDYATVAMRFSMIDLTRDASGRVVDGSPTERVTATELWTFLRAPGGRWVLSAIQQAR